MVPTGEKAGWAPEPVWTLLKYFVPKTDNNNMTAFQVDFLLEFKTLTEKKIEDIVGFEVLPAM
jgi:hypothetical protein